MSNGNGDRAWTALQKFFRLRNCRQPPSSAWVAHGRAARVLAASKPGGLLLNIEAPELGFYIADGMDITSQLINVTSEPEDHAALKELLRDDIRISVHAQHPVEFLGDVRDHRFDLVVFGRLDPPATGLAAASLAPGGLLAVFQPEPGGHAGSEALEQTLSDCGLLIAPGPGGSLVAARAPDYPAAKRRGGRRKRPPPRG